MSWNAVTPLAPLVEQRDGEHERQDGGQRRAARRACSSSRPSRPGRSAIEPQEQPIEQARGSLVQRGQPSRHRAPAGGPARSARRGTAAGRPRTARRLRSGSCPTPPAGGPGRRPARSPRSSERVRSAASAASASRWATSAADQPPAVAPIALPLGRRRRPTAGCRASRRVASPVGACQSFRARAHARQRPAAGTPGPGERVDRAAREASMATRRQVHLDAAFVGPAPERVGIDAEPAGWPVRGTTSRDRDRERRTHWPRAGTGCRRPAERWGNARAGRRQVDSGIKSWVNLGIRDSSRRAEDRRPAEAMSTAPRDGAASCRRGRLRSGGDELVIVAMDPVAQAPARWIGRDRDRPHDLADLAATAEQEVRGRPSSDGRRRGRGGTGTGPG